MTKDSKNNNKKKKKKENNRKKKNGDESSSSSSSSLNPKEDGNDRRSSSSSSSSTSRRNTTTKLSMEPKDEDVVVVSVDDDEVKQEDRPSKTPAGKKKDMSSSPSSSSSYSSWSLLEAIPLRTTMEELSDVATPEKVRDVDGSGSGTGTGEDESNNKSTSSSSSLSSNTDGLSPPHHHQSRSVVPTSTTTNVSSDTGSNETTSQNHQSSSTNKTDNDAVPQTPNDTATTTTRKPAPTSTTSASSSSSSASLPPKPASTSSATTTFAQLAYRTIETYVSEAIHEAKAEQFPPLQLLQQMNICDVTGQGLARLTYSVSNTIGQQQQQSPTITPAVAGTAAAADHNGGNNGHDNRRRRPSKPIALRHIRSTPLQHTPSNLLDDEDEEEPPPIGLDILNRSRSTPLSMSKNSAFVRSNSQLSQGELSLSRQGSNSSAFTALAPYPMKKASSRSTETEVKPVIFNPIKLPEDVDVDDDELLGEMTSIEVVNIPKKKSREEEDDENNKKKKTAVDQNRQLNPASQTMTAASKAAKKFFSDVRKLRVRQQKVRGGRENPAQPPSISSDESSSAAAQRDDETLSSKSSSGNSGTTGGNSNKHSNPSVAGAVAAAAKAGNSKNKVKYVGKGTSKEGGERGTTYRSFEETESPATIPSPVYQQLGESPTRPASHGTGEDEVCIEVSSGVDRLSLAASPEPGRSSSRSGGAGTPHSHDSPQTSRYSSTTSSSGHTTHATNTTYSSGKTSLSAISETDREVMELNKTGGAREKKSGTSHEKDGETVDSDKTENIELALATGRNVRFGDYVELVDTPSPVNPRDGATVKADRFFTFNDKSEKRGLARLRSLPSVKRGGSSHSPTTISSASANTNSSTSTMAGDEPPMIVSYIDRKLDKKQVSDLTSHHHRETQSSSPRSGVEDRELRESSPSDQILIGDSDVVFEDAQSSPKDASANRPRPIWPAKGLHFGRKIRSLPPRSPHKGLRGSATPPPRGGSPAAAGALSPPRQILDQNSETNLLSSADKAYVVAPTSSSSLHPGLQAQALPSASNIGDNYTHVVHGESTLTAVGDHGSQEVIRLSPTPAAFGQSDGGITAAAAAAAATASTTARGYYNMSTGLPRGPSPVGHGRATYEENGIEIMKTNSKDDVATSSSSPVPVVTPDNAASSSFC